MIRTLRAFFLSRLLREKLLLVAFVLLGVLMWLSSFTRRTNKFWLEQRLTTATLADQKQWLNNKDAIEATERKAAASLDASKTLEATRLYAEVDRMAREAGLGNTALSAQPDERGGLFPLHTLQVTITKAEWPPLLKFYESLLARSPYINIEQFTLRVTPPNHGVSLRVSAVEIPK